MAYVEPRTHPIPRTQSRAETSELAQRIVDRLHPWPGSNEEAWAIVDECLKAQDTASRAPESEGQEST